MTRASLLAALLLGLIPGALAAAPGLPVQVGGEATLDACGANAAVALADPAGRLNARAGPGLAYPATARLPHAQPLIVCDESPDGAWLGVVFSPDGRACGLGSPIPVRQPYAGPCPSAWVARRYVRY